MFKASWLDGVNVFILEYIRDIKPLLYDMYFHFSSEQIRPQTPDAVDQSTENTFGLN